MSSHVLAVAVVLAVAGTQVAAAQRGGAMRFQVMDRNNDGRISRAEWNGSDQAFEAEDWNGDGVLSDEEVRPGGRRDENEDRDREFAAFNDWTVRGFNGLDQNRDNRITADEWSFDRESFGRADHNGDGVISRREFLNEDTDQDQDRERDDRFVDLDVNGDNRISRNEWRGTRANFDLLDDNRDGLLTRAEVLGSEAPKRTGAYQAGHDRGLIEGRAAGREDRERNQGWDLDGQRELDQADSGYNATYGPRADFQTGYREGFRSGYRDGYGQRPRP